jgi:hypothetical protein
MIGLLSIVALGFFPRGALRRRRCSRARQRQAVQNGRRLHARALGWPGFRAGRRRLLARSLLGPTQFCIKPKKREETGSKANELHAAPLSNRGPQAVTTPERICRTIPFHSFCASESDSGLALEFSISFSGADRGMA